MIKGTFWSLLPCVWPSTSSRTGQEGEGRPPAIEIKKKVALSFTKMHSPWFTINQYFKCFTMMHLLWQCQWDGDAFHLTQPIYNMSKLFDSITNDAEKSIIWDISYYAALFTQPLLCSSIKEDRRVQRSGILTSMGFYDFKITSSDFHQISKLPFEMPKSWDAILVKK